MLTWPHHTDSTLIATDVLNETHTPRKRSAKTLCNASLHLAVRCKYKMRKKHKTPERKTSRDACVRSHSSGEGHGVQWV